MKANDMLHDDRNVRYVTLKVWSSDILKGGESVKMIEFHHGALADSYEAQANAQGYTFGDRAKFVEDMGSSLLQLWFYDCVTDSECKKILRRFQENVLMRNIKVMEVSEDEASE